MAFVRFVFLVSAMVHCDLVNAASTSCNATYLTEENAAKITCYFESHVSNKTHEAFSVIHYSDTITGIGKNVLDCQYRDVTGDLLCDLNANYTFNRNVKDHIILGVPNATSFHAGTYACHLIPPSKTVLPCNLSMQVEDNKLEERHASSVEPAAGTCNATYLTEENAAKITCYFESHVSNKTHEAFSVIHYADTITGIGKNVLDCQYRDVTGDLLCDINANYTFNRNVKDHIILGVPNATSFHAGTYACHLIPPSKTVLPCNLSMQVEDHKVEERPASSVEPAAGSPSTSAPHSADTSLSVELSVTVALFVVVCAAIIFLSRKWFLKIYRSLRQCLVYRTMTSEGDQVYPSAQQAAGAEKEHQIKVDQHHVPPGSAQASLEVENNNEFSHSQSNDAVRKSKSEMDRLMSSAEDSEERREAALKTVESSAESETNSRAMLLRHQQQKRRMIKRTSSVQSQVSYKSVESDSDAADVSETHDSSV